MPGRDHVRVINLFGWLTVAGSLAGVGLHGLGRIVASRRKEGKKS
jgi:hypothetical protein